MTALLTAILLSMRAASQLPNIGYLVALDYIYFATYALILSGTVISVAELIANRRSKDKLAKRLELFGRVFQPFFFLPQLVFFFVCLDRQRKAPLGHKTTEEKLKKQPQDQLKLKTIQR